MWIGCTELINARLDGLFDPPAGIRAETNVQFRIETFNRLEQADIAFLNQVRQGHTAAGVVFGNIDHETEIGTDHLFARGGIVIPDNATRKFLLAVSAQ